MCNSILLIRAIILLLQQSYHLTPHNIITNKYCITFPKGGGTKGFCFPLSRSWMEEKEIFVFYDENKTTNIVDISRIMREISRATFPYSSSYYPLCSPSHSTLTSSNAADISSLLVISLWLSRLFIIHFFFVVVFLSHSEKRERILFYLLKKVFFIAMPYP